MLAASQQRGMYNVPGYRYWTHVYCVHTSLMSPSRHYLQNSFQMKMVLDTFKSEMKCEAPEMRSPASSRAL